MDLFQKCHDYTAVKEAIAAGIYPYFHALESGQDTEVVMEGRRTIMIGSNNYLGLTSDPRVKEAARKALEKYGTGCSGSRFLNGTLDLHIELERQLAEFLNKESCITFSTGFQTNLGIISAIAGRNDYIICDKENHASIYDACRLSFATMVRYKHDDMEDLERVLSEIPGKKGKLIVTDGVFSMGGEICNLPKIVELARKYGARVMVDDAHALGVLGERGRGTAEYFGLEDEVDIIMGTFSKSLASLGGYMAASEEVVTYVKHNSRPFIFSASIPPANAAAALAALNVLKEEPERVKRLNEIADYMRKLLRERNIPLKESQTPIIPVMAYDDIRTFVICRELLKEGVYVNPVISPAVPQGQSMIRTSYTATHTREQMEEAAEKFVKVFANF
ncbi:MAG: aminotransferase class I/II-fold pyridoxal phosphate-dependent enzyme [Clostridiaceae bacterium]|mgnify:FL=1|jgi:8-amino-7-oxononanoate synthase|nr:aminotransferase class I/II-fold pyridoxal phosphate-dependent enzyme [Clostridiaceae bacterium]